jgi:hypothetical protein
MARAIAVPKPSPACLRHSRDCAVCISFTVSKATHQYRKIVARGALGDFSAALDNNWLQHVSLVYSLLGVSVALDVIQSSKAQMEDF